MKFLIFAVLVLGAYAIEFDRPCRDDLPAKENFNTNFYTGIWYELYNSMEHGVDCIEHHYTRRLIGQVFDVERIAFANNNFHTESGTASIAFPEETPMRAIFNATVNRITGGVINYTYRILATDYTNYAIGWSCSDLPDNRSVEEGVVLGRGIDINEASWVKIDALLGSYDMNRADFTRIIHSVEACGLQSRN